jgi:hypothetical protein
MSEANNLVQLPVETQQRSEERRTTELVPQVKTATSLEVESNEVRDLGSAVTQLQSIIAKMEPDDLVLELHKDKSQVNFRLRAYRKV